MRYIVCVAGLVALLAACNEPAKETVEAPKADTDLSHAAQTVDIGTAHGQLANAKLDYTPPQGWVKQPISNPMRKDQYLLPGHDGADDGELTVFFFPDMDGIVAENVGRWLRQFEQPDGSSTETVATTSSSTVNGLKVTTVYATGIFLKPTSAMMNDSNVQRLNDYALMGAIVESREGPWFFKSVGPKKTLDHWKAGFESLVASVKAE